MDRAKMIEWITKLNEVGIVLMIKQMWPIVLSAPDIFTVCKFDSRVLEHSSKCTRFFGIMTGGIYGVHPAVQEKARILESVQANIWNTYPPLCTSPHNCRTPTKARHRTHIWTACIWCRVYCVTQRWRVTIVVQITRCGVLIDCALLLQRQDIRNMVLEQVRYELLFDAHVWHTGNEERKRYKPEGTLGGGQWEIVLHFSQFHCSEWM